MILAHKETPFGVLTVTRLGEQTTVYANNVPLFVSGDIAGTEEIVHFALVQRYHSPAVLIAGGNPSDLVPEVLRYAGSTVDCIEENPWLRQVEERYLLLPHQPRVRYVLGDLRRHLLSTPEQYDVIIVVAPEPSTLQLNRLYTRESIQLAYRALKRSGVLCLALPSSAEYAGGDARSVRAILRNTLLESFGQVRILPAGRDVFLASDSTLRMDIGAAIGETGVQTSYVNAYYIQDDLLAARAQRLSASINGSSGINTDAHPVLMLAQMQYWLRLFNVELWIPVLIGLVGVVFLFIHTDRLSLGVVTAGCGGITLELTVLMIVQVGFGNVYKVSGGLIGLYMAGMSVGAFAAGRLKRGSRWYTTMQCGLALTLVGTALLQPGVSAGSFSAVVGLMTCLFLGSLSAGAVFALTSRLGLENPVTSGSRLYGVDLLGSAMAAFFVGPFLLPLFGVFAVAGSAAAVVLFGAYVSLSSPAWRMYEKA